MSRETLPCIVCGSTLSSNSDEFNQPNDGVACTTRGNYGSTVWDPVLTGEFLEFNVCDECLVKAGEQNRVHVGRTGQPIELGDLGIVGWWEVPYLPVLWHKDLPGYNDTVYVENLAEFRALGKKAHLFPDLAEQPDEFFE